MIATAILVTLIVISAILLGSLLRHSLQIDIDDLATRLFVDFWLGYSLQLILCLTVAVIVPLGHPLALVIVLGPFAAIGLPLSSQRQLRYLR